MSTDDHNKTLVILHSAVASIFTIGLLAGPWFMAQTLGHKEQIPLAVVGFGIALSMAALLWSTAIAMQKRKPFGRKLALISAAVVLPLVWPLGIYTWWFMHSEDAKRMYGMYKE